MTSQISEPVEAQEIKPRHMTFPLTELNNKLFFGGNPLLTAYIAALSATFPAGEAEFIESIRLYRDKIEDPGLQQQIKGFIGQEGHHSHQHKKINKVFTDHGIDASRIEKHLYQDINKYTSQDYATPKLRLAVTAGMEHMTAILSQYILTHPDILESLEEPVRDLILWHCVEEIEHKSVAFDVFMLCEDDQKYLQKIQLLQTAQFAWSLGIEIHHLFWDPDVMNCAFRIPNEYNFDGEREKVALRTLAVDGGFMEQSHAFRKKHAMTDGTQFNRVLSNALVLDDNYSYDRKSDQCIVLLDKIFNQ